MTRRRPRKPSPVRRQFLAFVALAGTGLVLTTASVTAPDRVRPLRRAGLRVTGPLVSVGAGAATSLRDCVLGIATLWEAQAELEAARTELRDLRVLLGDREELAAENGRLRSLLDLRQRMPMRTMPALVVHRETSPDRLLVIDRGAEHGLAPDQAVLSPDGVVGKVLSVSGRMAQVQCLTDPDAGIAVLVGDARRQANAIVGDGDGSTCRLRHVGLLAEVREGDRVVTSGLDQVHPKGLLVGVVVGVRDVLGVEQEITIRPAVDFDRLEEVLVVVSGDELLPEPDAIVSWRAP